MIADAFVTSPQSFRDHSLLDESKCQASALKNKSKKEKTQLIRRKGKKKRKDKKTRKWLSGLISPDFRFTKLLKV